MTSLIPTLCLSLVRNVMNLFKFKLIGKTKSSLKPHITNGGAFILSSSRKSTTAGESLQPSPRSPAAPGCSGLKLKQQQRLAKQNVWSHGVSVTHPDIPEIVMLFGNSWFTLSYTPCLTCAPGLGRRKADTCGTRGCFDFYDLSIQAVG